MHYAFTEDQLMFRDAVRSALEREVTPERLRARWESEDTAADEAALWETLAGLGLLGMMAPTARGGLGMSLLDVTLLLEETGRVALPAPLVATSVMAAPLLAEVPEAAERWLKPLIGGDAIVAVGLVPVLLLSRSIARARPGLGGGEASEDAAEIIEGVAAQRT